MRDTFFSKRNCDRCGADLSSGRIMSMYNNDVLCMTCKEKETHRSDYHQAVQADVDAIKQGNPNFPGIGLKKITTESLTDLIVKLVGEDGNAFAILGRVRATLRKGGYPQEFIEQFTKEATAGDYDHLLQTVMKYVNFA